MSDGAPLTQLVQRAQQAEEQATTSTQPPHRAPVSYGDAAGEPHRGGRGEQHEDDESGGQKTPAPRWHWRARSFEPGGDPL